MQISIERLRRFRDRNESARAALDAVNKRVSELKKDLAHAESQLAIFDASLVRGPTNPSKSDQRTHASMRAIHERDVATAREGYEAACAARDHASGVQRLASRLFHNGLTFAKATNQCPRDLMEAF